MQDRENRIKVASVEGGLGALGVAQLSTIEGQSGQKAILIASISIEASDFPPLAGISSNYSGCAAATVSSA